MPQLIRIARDAELRAAEALDLNRDGRVSPGELAGATVLLVAGLFLALNVGICAVAVLLGLPFADFAKLAPRLVAGILVTCILAGATLFAWRLVVYEKQERVEREERRRRHEREDYEFDVLRGVARREEDTRWTDEVQAHYARLWLRLSYERGAFLTRDEWKARGLPVDAWNRINELAKKRHLRHGRSPDLQHATLAEAWGAWCDAELASRAWVKSGGELLKD